MAVAYLFFVRSMELEWTKELRHAAEYQVPEVVVAMALRGYADEHLGQKFRIDQTTLNEMIELGIFKPALPAYKGARIDRLCLHFRLFCRLAPGGEPAPPTGVTEWANLRGATTNYYGVLRFSPENDWLEIVSFTHAAAVSPDLTRR